MGLVYRLVRTRLFIVSVATAMLCPSTTLAQESLDEGLRGLVNIAGLRRNSSPVQTFHIGVVEGGDHRWVVYWPEARRLFWIPEAADVSFFSNLKVGSDMWDVETGLANTQEQIGDRTHIRTEAWALEQIEIAMTGRTLVVNISVPGRARWVRRP